MNQPSSGNVSSGSPSDSVRKAMAQIKIEKTSPSNSSGSCAKKSLPCARTKKSQTCPNSEASTSTIIILDNPIDEIITLDDTQSSQISFENIFGGKSDMEDLLLSQPSKKLGAYQPDDNTFISKAAKTRKSDDVICPDCEKVN